MLTPRDRRAAACRLQRGANAHGGRDVGGGADAGVFILVYRPYDEGDVVEAGGVLGRVKEMGLANTTIVTFDNRRLFVPNRKIWQEVIENRSAETTRRVEAVVRIRYDEDIEKTTTLIREILDQHELVLKSPEPTIFVSELSASWVELAVWPWATGANWWDLTIDLPRALRLGLQKGGVDVPYPRQEIDVSSSGKDAQGPGTTAET